ncbi:MAG: hypothetical protein QOI81_1531 [Actinomycetota bacterium]|jgi:nitrite reductase/ring-hydroxylating ferredoxin subunit|nr:hypothetical protein [Actinomycetota bacterium]
MKPRRVARFVDSLLRDRRPRRFEADTEDAEAIRAAVELHAAEPGAAEPTDQFVRQLQARLQERIGTVAATSADEQAVEETLESVDRPRMSRRHLLEGAGVAASTAFIALIADRLIEAPSATKAAGQQPMVPDGGQWVNVATADRVDASRVTAFSASEVVGFVVNDGGNLRALSGICTHQGCVLHANQSATQLDCPCHRAAFSLDGKVLSQQFAGPLPPLPTLMVRRVGTNVQVLLPPPQSV